MAQDPDDPIASIGEMARREYQRSVERQAELAAKAQQEELDVRARLDYLRFWEAAEIRPFIAKALTMVLVALVVGSIAAALYGASLPANEGDVLMERVLKVNQSIIPVITLVIGYYFGASR